MKEYDFYIVPTPIGNLEDITKRAIDVLKKVDIVACEDIRVTQKLLNHFDIKTKCISYHKFNEKERVNYFLTELNAGKKIALVSDAGTPLFCDPGAIIVKELRKNNFTVTSLAGANAVATFLSQNSRDGEDFYFAGFMPRSQNQVQKILLNYKNTDIIFYESPNRILKTLELIRDVRKNPLVGIGRELTKIFEEVVIKNSSDIIEYYNNNTLKGEIVAIVYRDKDIADITDLNEKIKLLKEKNFSNKDISIILSQLYNLNKNEIYNNLIDK